MRFLTIKGKITLWYSLFMVIIVSIILGVLVEYTDMAIITNQKNQLVETVEDTVEDILEGDNIDFFDDGIYLIKYNSDKEYMNGSIPEKFSVSFPLEENKVKKIKNNSEKFYIYDKKIIIKDNETVWIRGVVSDVQANEISRIIIGGAFIILPFLVIISTIIGYLITKRAFYPVRKIQETAQNITESNELSLRINLSKGKDEISKLGETIDNMLDKLEKSFKKEKQFTSDASHELRTPVSVILAESEYIINHGENIEEAIESMEVINRQANKMSELINQLLFFSRADSDNIKLNFEDIDIVKTINELVSDNKIYADEKNISIKVENLINEDKKYCVDKILFIRAVQNLIQNSIVYGKENGHIEIKLYEDIDFFAVEVKDDGIGIDEKNLNKIWDRFFQADKARSNNRHGMGLGLSMVKWIVEKHDGKVLVKSTLGKGSVFTLFFSKKIKK